MRSRPLGFQPFTAAIESTVDPVATHRQAMCDAVSAPVEPCIHAVTASFERGSAMEVPKRRLPFRASVEAVFDAVAAAIETSLHDDRALVQVLVDPVTAPVEALFDALAMIGRHEGAGSQEQQRAGQREGQDSHGILLVCRTTLLQGKRLRPTPVDSRPGGFSRGYDAVDDRGAAHG